MKIRTMSLAILLLLATADPARASVAYQGNDISRLTHEGNRLWVCDREVDGNRAYAVAGTGGMQFSVVDRRGGDGYCASKNPPDKGAAAWHYTAEKGGGTGKTSWHRKSNGRKKI